MRKLAFETAVRLTAATIWVVDKITWFASFAPVEAPRYVVVVMVESGKSGGHTCAPVAGVIYQEIVKIEQQARQNTLAITQ